MAVKYKGPSKTFTYEGKAYKPGEVIEGMTNREAIHHMKFSRNRFEEVKPSGPPSSNTPPSDQSKKDDNKSS